MMEIVQEQQVGEEEGLGSGQASAEGTMDLAGCWPSVCPFTDAGVMVPVRGEVDGFPGRRWRSPCRVLKSSWMEGPAGRRP